MRFRNTSKRKEITFTYIRFGCAPRPPRPEAISLLNHICRVVLNIWPRGEPNSGTA